MADRPDSLRDNSNSSAKARRPIAFAAILVAIVAVELAFVGWFVTVPLPNAGNAGVVKNQRIYLLITSLPEIVPGVHWDESHLGLAIKELGRFDYLPQRLPIVLAAALIAGAAIAIGRGITRGLKVKVGGWEGTAVSFGLGCVALGCVTLAIGRIGLPTRPIVIGALAAIVTLEIVWSWKFKEKAVITKANLFGSPLSNIAFVVVAGPFLLIMALAAMLPTADFDSIEYHLQAPKEYVENGRIAFLPHNVYASMPFGVEMLHVLGMIVFGDWKRGALVGRLLVAAFAPAAMILIAGSARKTAGPRAGWVAAIVYISTPWIYRLAAIPYVEGPLCYFHAALIWAIVRVWNEQDRLRTARLWGLVGGFAGGAFTCKYPGLISAIAPASLAAAFAAVSKQNGKIVAYFVAGAAVAVGPWLLKSAIDTGNPVYPLGYRVFGGRFWDDELDAKWSRAHGRRPISGTALVDSALDVVGKNDWQSPLFAMLAPLALLRAGSRKAAVVLCGYSLYIFLTWWTLTHRLDRFWLPLAVPSAILAGIGSDWVKSRAWSVVLAGIVFFGVFSNFVFDSTKLAAFNQWTGDLDALDVRVPGELHSLPLSLLDASLPKETKILIVGQAGVFHVEHAIVYDTVFNRQTFETLAEGRSEAEIHRELRQQKITHIYVDWPEIRRYRSPGNYGFPAFVVPAVFDRLVGDGVLEPASIASPGGVERLRKAGVTIPENGVFKFEQKLYKVR